MTTPPDKLFRDRLEHYSKPAPSSAWDRIESGFDRKKKRSPWIKIAAGLVLVIFTSAVILQFNQTDSAVATNSTESAPVTLENDANAPAATDSKELGNRRQEAVGSSQLADRSRDVVVRRESSIVSREPISRHKNTISNTTQVTEEYKNSKSSHQHSTVNSQQFSNSNEETVAQDESKQVLIAESYETSVEPMSVSKVEATTEIFVTQEAIDSRRANITYSVEEVNQKFLKKEPVTEATPEKKNTSGLQKVIDLALDFKNEGTVLGELREKKNELLSFNAPSTKRETNK